jgi:hypothetical protein
MECCNSTDIKSRKAAEKCCSTYKENKNCVEEPGGDFTDTGVTLVTSMIPVYFESDEANGSN